MKIGPCHSPTPAPGYQDCRQLTVGRAVGRGCSDPRLTGSLLGCRTERLGQGCGADSCGRRCWAQGCGDRAWAQHVLGLALDFLVGRGPAERAAVSLPVKMETGRGGVRACFPGRRRGRTGAGPGAREGLGRGGRAGPRPELLSEWAPSENSRRSTSWLASVPPSKEKKKRN